MSVLRQHVFSFILPILVLGAVAAGLLAVRQRSASIRAVFFLTLTMLLGWALYRYDTSPLLTGRAVPVGPEGHFLRAVAIAWWFTAANLAALIVDRILGLDTLFLNAMLSIVVFGMRTASDLYIEAALVIGMLGFAATIALAKFLMRGEVIE